MSVSFGLMALSSPGAPVGDSLSHLARPRRRLLRAVGAGEAVEPRGGLTALCTLNADMSRTLVAPIVEQTTAFLSDMLPVQLVRAARDAVSAKTGTKAPSVIRVTYPRCIHPM